MKILKPIFAKSLLGIHILRPFHKLMMVSSMNYGTLLEAYPKLHDELQNCITKGFTPNKFAMVQVRELFNILCIST